MGFEGKKVLVVDDSAVMRQIIKKNLKELGFSGSLKLKMGPRDSRKQVKSR